MNTQKFAKSTYGLTSNNLVTLISWACALLFLYAAFYKLMDYKLFRLSLEFSPLIGRYAFFLSICLPILEITIGLLLIYDHTRILGFYGFLFIMVAFSLYIFWILHYSPTIPCSCGGVLQRMSWTTHLIFNVSYIIFGFIGLALLKLCNRNFS